MGGDGELDIRSIIPSTEPKPNTLEAEFRTWLQTNMEQLNIIASHFDENGISKEEISATAFSDYYKWSMSPIFIKMNNYFKSKPKPEPEPETTPEPKFESESEFDINKNLYVTFGVDIRDNKVKEELTTNRDLTQLIETNLSKFAERKFNKEIFTQLVEFKRIQSDSALVPPVSQLCLTETDIDLIVLGSSGEPRQIAHSRICQSKYVPGSDPTYSLDDVVISCYHQNDTDGKPRYFIEAIGPWHKVTWLETSMMQNVYETISTYKRELAGKTYKQWLYNALFRCYESIKHIEMANKTRPIARDAVFNGALFTGRRTGGLAFLLLQNYLVKKAYMFSPPPTYFGCIGTSSVDAWYLFNKWGIDVQLNPVGTHAHELSMVMSQLFPQLDEHNVPLTQILGHYLYYKLCNIRQGTSMKIPMLPDTLGTPSFMLAANIINIDRETFLSKCIVAARQDSGTLEGFVNIMDYFNCKVPIMASEIDNTETFNKALKLTSPIDKRFPYANFGAGGFFGDSPKVWGYDEFYLSMAVKPVRVFVGDRVGYPVKLGDSESAKVIGKISIDGTLAKEDYDEIVSKASAIKQFGIDFVTDKGNISDVVSKHQSANDLFKEIVGKLGI